MKNQLLFIALLCPFLLFAQEQYYQIEMIRLSPNPAHIKELSAGMTTHNKKFHASGNPYQAVVFQIATGPDAGDMVWVMGPATFTDLDNRPSDGGHDEDWAGNVVPYLTDVAHGEYWRRDNDMAVNPPEPGTPPYPMYNVRYHTINKGQAHRLDGLLEKVHATIKTMDFHFWAIYNNIFLQGYENGRHIASVTGMKNWAEFDKDMPFEKKFEEVHGPGSFAAFSREWEEVVANSWDEVWVLDKKLSGMEE